MGTCFRGEPNTFNESGAMYPTPDNPSPGGHMQLSATAAAIDAIVITKPAPWWRTYLIRSWSALLLTPAIAMGNMALAYTLVGPICQPQDHDGLLHALSLCSLAVSLMLSLLASIESRELAPAPHEDPLLKRFFSVFACYVALLFSLDTFMQCLAILLMSPC